MIKKIAHALTRKPKLVALIAVLLLIPSALGYIGTRVNYDILSYLPEDLDSVQGERLLEEPFHMAATSMLIVEGMPAAYTNDLINEIKEVPGVSSAIWLSNAVGIQIPTDFIPAALRDKQRRKYYEGYTGQLWGDPQNHDLNIDTSVIPIHHAVELIVSRF